ncbi:hypothetical protein [Actinotalea sp. K2]|uniref:hypothetical protein n=1 Tax=Actinotalea sp. K2 TaxID=2939438 RepID=UPI002017A775|nr:hypothetical protein [Actinotalea sp. K2]MCL3860903.1 hypothetical protein [Actinotalea sp. K2]
MGDHAVAKSTYSSTDIFGASAPSAPVPPQVLARWAALAAERASMAFLPHQVPTRAAS